MEPITYESDNCYKALVDSSVAEISKNNVFGSLQVVAKSAPTAKDFVDYCTQAEIAYKRDYKCTVLPNPYRSAKSVLVTALRHNIDISNKGKSELQAEIKETKQKLTTAKLPDYSEFTEALVKLAEIVGSLTEEGKIKAKQEIKTIFL
jgi:hypothetical protein